VAIPHLVELVVDAHSHLAGSDHEDPDFGGEHLNVSVLGVVLITRTGIVVSDRDSPRWWWSWSCGRVRVGADRAFGPPVGFGRLAAVAELPDIGALDSV
jgi:hypothetical protein